MRISCFIIRSRLHAISAVEILRLRPTKYFLVEIYTSRAEIDSTSKVKAYRLLRAEALMSAQLASEDHVCIWLLKLILAFFIVNMFGGKVYLASIDSYPIAVAALVSIGITINTFDDGNANFPSPVRGETIYSCNNLLPGNSIGRKLLRWLFPAGSTTWFRSVTCRHFTLHIQKKNIVEPRRLVGLCINWASWLEEADDDILHLKPGVIVLGTAFQDFCDSPHFQSRLLKLRDACMSAEFVYIAHPRELSEHLPASQIFKVARPVSPVESLLAVWGETGCLSKVFHFDSATAENLKSSANFKFVNLFDSASN